MGVMGSGKTTVSQELEKQGFVHFGIDHFYQKAKFKRNYDIKTWYKDEEYCITAYDLMLEDVLERLKYSNVIFEFTGASKHGIKVFKELEQGNFGFYPIFIDVPFEIICERIKLRNASDWPVKNTEEDLHETIRLIDKLKPRIDYHVNGDQGTSYIVQEISDIVNK